MLHVSLLVMNRPNKTEFAIFVSLMQSLLSRDLTNQNLFIFTAAGVVLCGGRKTSHRADIFWSFGITEFIFSHLKKEFVLSRC